ncbi:biopolymer transport protein [Xenococcus sp. PCC 7305]|uniref:ExbD/TolR family protein n=1 Tax=Xenococcus sp. PCC 7305 TaxID=102125 RepID=UPI0002ABEF06|nr:biopolymer transporter ExbD [Xenococcus sp. PCC 7305]ELS04676.1 biopolymer transport protein [Xenococcus sp. PCC 7305]
MTAKKKRSHKKYSAAPIRRFRLWQDETQNSEVKIELLPLIDVIFCILTFFLLAAVNFSRQQAISLDLPQARTGTPQLQEMLLVSIDNIGQLYVEKELVTKNVLSAKIVEYKENNPDGLMVLYASRNTTYREVVEVLDLLRQLGGERVALATIPLGNYVPVTPQVPNLPTLPGFPNPPLPPNQ